jgi:ATP phosphoribosyltransferase regulatory subunit
MSLKERWLLPEGIDELMPKEAAQLECLRRQLVDKMQSWGYQLVFPPLVEYLDSLLTGTGKELDLHTFKLTDQMSGRLMGIRADMTPQVARMASHNLREQQGELRLCYIGNVLHTLPAGQGTSRNPIQLGAEIYGHSGPESDLEVIQLMVETLSVIENNALLLDLGHVGIYRGLAAQAGLNAEQEQDLFSALQRKAIPEIELLLKQYDLEASNSSMLLALAELNGGFEVLEQAKSIFVQASEAVKASLDTLITIAHLVRDRIPSITLNFDLAELRGYHYHTGIVFAAYQQSSSQAIAQGGRYDDIGADFGQKQPATGFSVDLKKLIGKIPSVSVPNEPITVIRVNDAEQANAVQKLRALGEKVIYQLSDTAAPSNKKLIKLDGRWQVTETGK